jgi:hypothetical protein
VPIGPPRAILYTRTYGEKSTDRCAGYAHHVTHRGNRSANVFRDGEDRICYLRLLREKSIIHHVLIWVYTLIGQDG